MPEKKRAEGFTLLEILIACAIIATLMGIAVPTYTKILLKFKNQEVGATLEYIAKEIKLFELEHGRLPDSLAEAGIDETDPWGNPFQYIAIQGKPLNGPGKVKPRKDKNTHPLNSDFDLWSMGPDGKTALPLTANASHDDLIRAGNGSYIGVAEGY